MNDNDSYKICKKRKNTLTDFLIGNPWGMTSKSTLQRFVVCPYCDKEVEVPKYTRDGTPIKCNICNNIFIFKRY